MTSIAIRGYTIKPGWKPSSYELDEHPLTHRRTLTFDTETTTDRFQNNKIGKFSIHQDGILQMQGLFYEEDQNTDEENKTAITTAKKKNIPLYTTEEFITDVFYPEIYELRTLCIGFNLFFDLRSISIGMNSSRARNKGGFTISLSANKYLPQIITKRLGSSRQYTFSKTKFNQGDDYFPGYFLDVQQLAEVLLDKKKISLEETCKALNTKTKKKKELKHGKITPSYIRYLMKDVQATYEVYEKLMEELAIYQIDIPPTKVYSAASLGKYALEQLGVKPFMIQNEDFPAETYGEIMTTYSGGRTECRYRKKPIKITSYDFTSMYPTIEQNMGLWDLIIAEKVKVEDATDEVKEILEEITSEKVVDKEIWKKFPCIVKCWLRKNTVPVRAKYAETHYNLGINHHTCHKPQWLALPDVVSAKLIDGYYPEVIEAKKFIPQGVQKGLKKTTILGKEIDPAKDDVIKILVEERYLIKKKLEDMNKDDPEYDHLKRRAQAMKILVNAMSYGIFIELNPEDERSEIEVYGVDKFTTCFNRFEKPGKYFHPIVATSITSGARLLLSMAEVKVREHGFRHVYMDTDSIYVPIEAKGILPDYFSPLNPYSINIPLLKVEEEDVWFYGICSKRYNLYDIVDGEIVPRGVGDDRSYKLHGLGHLTNPFGTKEKDWYGQIWMDIMKHHYGKIKLCDIKQKYASMYAISSLTISTPHVWNKFSAINRDENGDMKPWKQVVKPGGFMHIGFQTHEDKDKPIKPLAPFSNDPQEIIYKEFIDYSTGKKYKGTKYFKPLSSTIIQYMNHPESKFNGDVGWLERKHIFSDDITIIGKEVNDIEDEPLEEQPAQVFKNIDKISEKILNMTQDDARKIGFTHRSALTRIQQRIRDGEFSGTKKNDHKILKYIYRSIK